MPGLQDIRHPAGRGWGAGGTLRRLWIALAFTAPLLSACESTEGTVALGVIGATVAGANSPSQEIQQIYYLGAFDPQGQLPPTVYRVRVHGQASFISFVRFASGWVPAPFIDSLGSSVGFAEEKSTSISIDPGASDKLSELTAGRRLMLFGPEGFREAPKDHRLVVVMGSSPEDFFNAIDQSLGIIAEARSKQRDNKLDKKLFAALAALRDERATIDGLNKAVDADIPKPAGGAS